MTKYKHNKIVEEYRGAIKDLREALWRKEKIEEICDKLADKTEDLSSQMGHYASMDIMDSLDDTVPRYVEDYFGGKVIKQEATPVTILDANGKATYGLTAKKPEKGKTWILHYEF